MAGAALRTSSQRGRTRLAGLGLRRIPSMKPALFQERRGLARGHSALRVGAVARVHRRPIAIVVVASVRRSGLRLHVPRAAASRASMCMVPTHCHQAVTPSGVLYHIPNRCTTPRHHPDRVTSGPNPQVSLARCTSDQAQGIPGPVVGERRFAQAARPRRETSSRSRREIGGPPVAGE